MQTTVNSLKYLDFNMNEECESFCSSCEAVLHSTYSVGIPSYCDNLPSKLIDRHINIQIQKADKLIKCDTENAEHTLLKAQSHIDNNPSKNLLPSIDSQCRAECAQTRSILDHRKNILNTATRLLDLCTYMDNIRKIITEEVDLKSETSDKNVQENINKDSSESDNNAKILVNSVEDNNDTKCIQDLPMYYYNPLRINK